MGDSAENSTIPRDGVPMREATGFERLGPDGPPPTQVPRVIGMELQAAVAVLNQVGLPVGGITSAPTVIVPPGIVSGQDPPAGAVVPLHTPVQLVVAAHPGPPPPTTTQVPRVIGMEPGVATARLQGAGLRVGVITLNCHTGMVAPGKVCEQQPQAGAIVQQNSAVNLVVESPSFGPTPLPQMPQTPPRYRLR